MAQGAPCAAAEGWTKAVVAFRSHVRSLLPAVADRDPVSANTAQRFT